MKYFTIEELCWSKTANKLKINNEPDALSKHNLVVLTEECLDRVRELWGAPIQVKSGFRCAKLNSAVEGSPTSHHMYGMAADITTGTKEGNKKLFEMILQSGIQFTQLIDEKNYSWIHIAYDPNHLKNQVLKL